MKNFKKCSDRNREIPPPTTPSIFGHPGGWHAPSVSSAVARGRRGVASGRRGRGASPASPRDTPGTSRPAGDGLLAASVAPRAPKQKSVFFHADLRLTLWSFTQ